MSGVERCGAKRRIDSRFSKVIEPFICSENVVSSEDANKDYLCGMFVGSSFQQRRWSTVQWDLLNFCGIERKSPNRSVFNGTLVET